MKKLKEIGNYRDFLDSLTPFQKIEAQKEFERNYGTSSIFGMFRKEHNSQFAKFNKDIKELNDLIQKKISLIEELKDRQMAEINDLLKRAKNESEMEYCSKLQSFLSKELNIKLKEIEAHLEEKQIKIAAFELNLKRAKSDINFIIYLFLGIAGFYSMALLFFNFLI